MTEEQQYQELVFDKQEDEDLLNQINQDEYFDLEEPDAHCCSMNSDAYGFCEICGAAVFGSQAYRNLYGGE